MLTHVSKVINISMTDRLMGPVEGTCWAIYGTIIAAHG